MSLSSAVSLSSALQLGANALLAQQVGLQVVGNNIANASNPTFIRLEVQFSPAPAHLDGDLLVGLGVQVEAVKQKIDKFLETRLRAAIGELANSEAQERAFAQLESIVVELTDTDLSTSLTDFYGSINDILNQPDSLSVRNLAGLHGKTLTQNIQRIAQRVFQLRLDTDTQVLNIEGDINGLTTKIAKLNLEIVSLEGGGVRASDAVGLRDER